MALKSPIFDKIMNDVTNQAKLSSRSNARNFSPNGSQLATFNPDTDTPTIDTPQMGDLTTLPGNEGNDMNQDNNASKIRKAEGNNYAAFADIGDGAGISVGAYQFTEKSGMAGNLAKEMGFKSIKDPGFREALNTPKGKAAQDKLYGTYTRRPQELGRKYNLDNNTVGFLIDTNINGGLNDVVKRASTMNGGLNISNLKKARLDRYASLIKGNPSKYGKFKKGWENRVNDW